MLLAYGPMRPLPHTEALPAAPWHVDPALAVVVLVATLMTGIFLGMWFSRPRNLPGDGGGGWWDDGDDDPPGDPPPPSGPEPRVHQLWVRTVAPITWIKDRVHEHT